MYFGVHNHSHYSNLRLKDCTNTPKQVIDTAIKKGLKGIALTDHEIVSGHYSFWSYYNQLKKEDKLPQGFKIALGNEIYLIDKEKEKEAMENKEKFHYDHFILIAKNDHGLLGLRKLSSQAWKNEHYYRGMQRVPTYYDELKEIMKEYKGDIIASSACFLPGTKVKTLEGYKNIENIKVGDFVLNKNGEYEKVNYPTSRLFKGTGYQLSKFGNNTPIKCTDNHKFLTQNKKTKKIDWIEAKKINKKEHWLLESVEKRNYTNNYEVSININGLPKRKKNVSKFNKIKNNICITPMFARFIGYWLGDGHCVYNEDKGRYQVGLTVNLKEYEYLKPMIDHVEKLIGVKSSVTIREKNSRVDIIFNSKQFTYLFLNILDGEQKAKNKHIPEGLLNISENISKEILIGLMLSDGYFREKKKNNTGEFVFASISYQLSQQVRSLLNSFVSPASFSVVKEKIDKNNVHHQESYYVSCSSPIFKEITKQAYNNSDDVYKLFNFALNYSIKKNKYTEDGKYIKRCIKDIKEIKINERVYCLNNNSHSFHVENILVHNCLGSPLSKLLLQYNQEKTQENWLKIHNFVKYLIDVFGKENIYFESQPSHHEEQKIVNNMLKVLSKHYGILNIVSTDAHYAEKKNFPSHRTFLESQDGEREAEYFYATTYIMSHDELLEFFEEDDLKTLEENTNDVYDKIEEYHLDHQTIIPKSVIPTPFHLDKDKLNNKYKDYQYIIEMINSKYIEDNYYISLVLNGINNRPDVEETDEVLSRIDLECSELVGLTEQLKQPMSSYFLLMKDFIDIMWEVSLVGPARGSASCWLTNYLIGITEVNSLTFNLPHWR